MKLCQQTLEKGFPAVPAGFETAMNRAYASIRAKAAPPKRYARRLAFSLAVILLLLGTALALENFGVLHFFTTRYEQPIDEKTIAQPTQQSCDSKLLTATLRDAYWDGETLSISVSVQPKDESTAMYTETDVGTDGESFDKIWWKGEILSFDKWRAGRKTLELMLPTVTSDRPITLKSWDWVQEAQGETMLIELRAADMTQGATLTVTLNSRVLDTDETETATLTATLPAMTKGEAQE